MKQYKSVALIILCLGLLVGCASGGSQAIKNETPSTISSKIIEGKTTATEIKAMFGGPTSTSLTESGFDIWQYSFDKISHDAVSYIPVVGMFAGSASGTSKTLTVLFDEHSVVKKAKMSEAPIKYNTGMFNQ